MFEKLIDKLIDKKCSVCGNELKFQAKYIHCPYCGNYIRK